MNRGYYSTRRSVCVILDGGQEGYRHEDNPPLWTVFTADDLGIKTGTPRHLSSLDEAQREAMALALLHGLPVVEN